MRITADSVSVMFGYALIFISVAKWVVFVVVLIFIEWDLRHSFIL